MYKILDSLPEEWIERLKTLKSEVNMRPSLKYRPRMGQNRSARLSDYYYSRYISWKAAQRKEFLDCYPDQADSKALAKWFVEFKPETGFLDIMDAWENDRVAAYLTCYLIEGNGTMQIQKPNSFDYEEVVVQLGQGISFPLNVKHSINETSEGSTWACVMTLENVWNVE